MVTLTMTAANQGESDLAGVTLRLLTPDHVQPWYWTDALPPASASGNYYSGDGASWTLGTLAAGQSRTVSVSVQVDYGSAAPPPDGTLVPVTARAMATDGSSAAAQSSFRIGRATPTIIWAAPHATVYGTALGSAQLNATANTAGTFTYTPAAGTVLGAGSHTLRVSFVPTDSTNWTTATAEQTIDVGKAALTVSATSRSRPYNQANPVLTWTATGFVNGDTVAVLSGAPLLNCAATPTSSVAGSPYPITIGQGTLAAANYDIALVNGTLTVHAPEAVSPSGTFVALIDPAGVAAGHAWWDITGTYTMTVAGQPLDIHLLHDSGGKLTGMATYPGTGGTVVSMPVRGSVSGAAVGVTATFSMRGTDPSRTISVALALDLAIDAPRRQLTGRISGSVKSGGASTAVATAAMLPIAAPMDGTWVLALQLSQGPRDVTGMATLELSNGSACGYRVQGRAVGRTAVLSLTGAPGDPAARGMRIQTTIIPLEGGKATVVGLSGRAYGQALVW
jgi:hypothetical protein